MALLLRKRLIVIETESLRRIHLTGRRRTRGDLSITQSSDAVSRDLIRPYLGASQQPFANTRVECTFSVELPPALQVLHLSTARHLRHVALLKLWLPTPQSLMTLSALAFRRSRSTTTLMASVTR